MEALLEREADVESWNDERMDELSGRADAGFKEMREGFAQAADEEETNRRFDKVDHELGRVNDRLDRMTYGLALFAISLIGTVAVSGFGGG